MRPVEQLVSPEFLCGQIHAGSRLPHRSGQSELRRSARPEMLSDAARHFRTRSTSIGTNTISPARFRRSRATRWPSAPRCCGCSLASATTRRRKSTLDAGLGRGDEPLRENRARAHHGRPQLGRREHRHRVGEAAGMRMAAARHDPDVPIAPSADRFREQRLKRPMADYEFRLRTLCLHADIFWTRPPVRARCRSTRRRRSCSTAPITRRACSTCRRSATSIRAFRIRPWRRSRSASPRSRAAARRWPRRPAWPRR